ncbi:hypothetical protein ElyMa_006407200 [Elysia marginata]|uniref:Uncharacterized protein n=1 Tax=Elysia marginata TaxID=1093978 RepID=A0AAV4HVL8_9GAST|nr:hypothetical protein ElyMa_006407200 [Elysia marginata]
MLARHVLAVKGVELPVTEGVRFTNPYLSIKQVDGQLRDVGFTISQHQAARWPTEMFTLLTLTSASSW